MLIRCHPRSGSCRREIAERGLAQRCIPQEAVEGLEKKNERLALCSVRKVVQISQGQQDASQQSSHPNR